MTDNTDSKPSLSQYFGNDPPSLFDEIGQKQEEVYPPPQQQFGFVNIAPDPMIMIGVGSSSGFFSPNLPQNDFLSNFQSEIETSSPVCTIPEDVRDLWEPPHIEPGIPPLLTMPGVMSVNDLTDPVRETVRELLGEEEASYRKLLTPDDVTQDERGLRNLIKAGCYRSAINLTSRLLTMYGQGYGKSGQPAKHTPHSLQLWFTRFALLLKIGSYDLCQVEIEAFGLLNRPDIYFNYYPEMYAGRKGSMASFSFRLLQAELPLYSGSYKMAMDRLSDIFEVCVQIKDYFGREASASPQKMEAMLFWQGRENRVLHSLINCSLLMKDFCLADNILTRLVIQSSMNVDERRALYSSWGRIYLQSGDIFGAERKFAESRKLKENPVPDNREYIDKGLVAVAQNDFQEAFLSFQRAFSINQSDVMLYNNMGVCLLYSGKLKEAISLYEKAIATLPPQKSLNESLLLNLSTLYELESNNFRSKKLELLKQINKFKADLNVSLDLCLKF